MRALKIAGPVVLVALIALSIQALSPLHTDAPTTRDHSPGALLMQSITTPPAQAFPSPVIGQLEAAKFTQLRALAVCSKQTRGSKTHTCHYYDTKAVIFPDCKVHHGSKLVPIWTATCPLLFAIKERGGGARKYGCVFVIAKPAPYTALYGRCKGAKTQALDSGIKDLGPA